MATPTRENQNQSQTQSKNRSQAVGSGSDVNSDTDRLHDEENLQDKIEEDSFPASDAPSHSPMTGVGRTESESRPDRKDPSGLSKDFKNDKVAQYEYGRKSQESTLHFDQTSDRLRKGNPDIGEVDLGTIEADKPAQKDDNDLYDTADDDSESVPPTDR